MSRSSSVVKANSCRLLSRTQQLLYKAATGWARARATPGQRARSRTIGRCSEPRHVDQSVDSLGAVSRRMPESLPIHAAPLQTPSAPMFADDGRDNSDASASAASGPTGTAPLSCTLNHNAPLAALSAWPTPTTDFLTWLGVFANVQTRRAAPQRQCRAPWPSFRRRGPVAVTMFARPLALWATGARTIAL